MAFAYKAAITIDHNKVATSTQANFSFLLSGTFAGTGGIPNLKTVANSGHVQNANGYDIYFFSDSGLTNRLCAERESYSATSGVIVYWIKIPSLSNTVDTVIYIAYGDSGISTDPNSDSTYGKTKSWDSNFTHVYHLDSSSVDSMASPANGTDTNIAYANQKIGNGASFTGSSSRKIAYSSKLSNTGAITFSFWFNCSLAQCIWFDENDSNTAKIGYTIRANSSGWIFFQFQNNGTTIFNIASAVATKLNNVWHLLHFTWDGTTNANAVKMYIDGAYSNQGTSTGAWATPTYNSTIGMSYSGSYKYTGLLDEFKIASTVRSLDWITTEFNNQNSPSTFFSTGSETSTGGGTSFTLTLPDTCSISINKTSLFAIVKSLSETITISANNSKSQTKLIAEVLTVSSTAALVNTFLRSFTENVNISDTRINLAVFLRTFTDNFQASDNNASLVSFIRNVADTWTAIDNQDKTSAFSRTIVDNVIPSDNFQNVNSFLFSLAENIVISGNVNSLTNYLREITNSVKADDSLESRMSFYRLMDDILWTHSSNRAAYEKTLAEIVLLSDEEISTLNLKFIAYLGIVGILKAYLGQTEINLK